MELHILHKTNFLTILVILFLSKQALSQYHFFNYLCYNTYGNYSDDSDYKTNVDKLQPKLTSLAPLSIFNNYTVGEGIDKAYGLYMCRGDLDGEQCHDCVKNAIISINEKCPNVIETIVWFDECIVRQANHSIFNIEDESLATTYSSALSNVTDPEKFKNIFGETVHLLIKEVAHNKTGNGYGATETDIRLLDTLYVMVQCTPDILGNRCERCLRVALRNIGGFSTTPRVKMRAYLPSCWLRYDNSPFAINADAPPSAPGPPAPLPTPSSDSSSSFESPPPAPEGNSGGRILSPTWITFALLLLIVIDISNTGVAL